MVVRVTQLHDRMCQEVLLIQDYAAFCDRSATQTLMIDCLGTPLLILLGTARFGDIQIAGNIAISLIGGSWSGLGASWTFSF